MFLFVIFGEEGIVVFNTLKSDLNVFNVNSGW